MSLPVVNVAVDFSNDGTWTDISAYMKRLLIKRGSSRVESPLIRYEAGTATLVLSNNDRRFDPTNTTGPYTIPGGVPSSGIQQAQSNQTQVYGHGFTVAVASVDPETSIATHRSVASTTSSSVSFTCTKPAGTASGDIMLAFQAGDWGSASSLGTPTGGTTWTLLTSRDGGDYTLHTKVWWKTAGGSEPSTYSFSQATGSDGHVSIVAIQNGTGTPVFDSTDDNGTAFFTTPAITPTGTADIEYRFVSATGGGSGSTWDWSGTSGPDAAPYAELTDSQSNAFTTGSCAYHTLDGLTTATGGTLVKPMRPIRIRAIWNSVTYDLFRGFVDSWDIEWNGPNWSEVTVPCTDAFKVFSSFDRKASESVSAPSELSSVRLNRILDNVGWPSADRSIATGDVTLQATTLNGNAMEEMLLTIDTEVGELYMDPAGKVFMRNRNAINNDSRSTTSQATFGDAGGAELPYSNLTFTNDDTQLVNRVIITRVGGSEQFAEDASSQDEFLVHSFERTDLLFNSDANALTMAQWVLSLSAQPALRFDGLEIIPQRDETNLFPKALGQLIGDRITVRKNPPGGGAVIEQDCFIRGIEHEVSEAKWVTRWILQSGASGGSFFIIGNSTRGRLDLNPLGF